MMYRWLIGAALLFALLLFMLPSKDEKSVAKITSASMLWNYRGQNKVSTNIIEYFDLAPIIAVLRPSSGLPSFLY